MRSINHSVTDLVSKEYEGFDIIFQFSTDRFDPCTADINEVISYIEKYMSRLDNDFPFENLYVIEPLSFLLFKWGAVVDSSLITQIINSPRSQKNILRITPYCIPSHIMLIS